MKGSCRPFSSWNFVWNLILVYINVQWLSLHWKVAWNKMIISVIYKAVSFRFSDFRTFCLFAFLTLAVQEFQQLVDVPTHDPTSTTTARAIDHCYVSKDLVDKVELKIHSPYYSDHDALCIKLKLWNKSLVKFKSLIFLSIERFGSPLMAESFQACL